MQTELKPPKLTDRVPLLGKTIAECDRYDIALMGAIIDAHTRLLEETAEQMETEGVLTAGELRDFSTQNALVAMTGLVYPCAAADDPLINKPATRKEFLQRVCAWLDAVNDRDAHRAQAGARRAG